MITTQKYHIIENYELSSPPNYYRFYLRSGQTISASVDWASEASIRVWFQEDTVGVTSTISNKTENGFENAANTD